MAEDISNLNINFNPQVNNQPTEPKTVSTEDVNEGIIESPNFSIKTPTGKFTPTDIPAVDVDFNAIRNELFIPNSGEPIRTSIDPTVIKNAEVLANTLNYNPVVMDYPYNMDPNSALFKLDKPQDDSLANTILNY